MSAKAPVNISITSGPNVDQVVEAFKYAYDKRLGRSIRPQFTLEFTSRSPRAFRTTKPMTSRRLVVISGLSYDSGTTGMFILTMNVLDGTYRAYYNANTRQGHLVEKL